MADVYVLLLFRCNVDVCIIMCFKKIILIVVKMQNDVIIDLD